MQNQPHYQIGQQVIAVAQRQGSYRGGRPSASAKLQEIADVIWHDDSIAFPAGWYYRLRRPGGKGKGGQVHHDENSLQAA